MRPALSFRLPCGAGTASGPGPASGAARRDDRRDRENLGPAAAPAAAAGTASRPAPARALLRGGGGREGCNVAAGGAPVRGEVSAQPEPGAEGRPRVGDLPGRLREDPDALSKYP